VSVKQCSECAFWLAGASNAGRCQRRAPSVATGGAASGQESWAVWPKTLASDGCGEFLLNSAVPNGN